MVNVLVWDQGESDSELDYYDASIKQVLQRYKNKFSRILWKGGCQLSENGYLTRI